MHYVKSISVLAVIAALTLTACGDDDDSIASSTTAPSTASTSAAPSQADAHNAADVTFLQAMIPHHEQALEMSQLAETRAESDQVKALAQQISAAQDPEIEKVTALLQRFGADVTAGGGGDHHSMDHRGMPGMMSADQLGQLESASGAGFDRMYLQMMIEHHRGAVTMSETELRDGQNSEVTQLAQQIIDAQQQEISIMSGLLSES